MKSVYRLFVVFEKSYSRKVKKHKKFLTNEAIQEKFSRQYETGKIEATLKNIEIQFNRIIQLILPADAYKAFTGFFIKDEEKVI